MKRTTLSLSVGFLIGWSACWWFAEELGMQECEEVVPEQQTALVEVSEWTP